jgi:hypothetical protein
VAPIPPSVTSNGAVVQGIAMWGPPSSGKTTFLGALNIALARQGSGWRIVGRDPGSRNLLTALTTSLASDRRFPPDTKAVETCSWQLTGNVLKTVRSGFLRLRKRDRKVTVSINLDLVDPPGGLYSPDVHDSDYARGVLVESLKRSRGIVFVLDPIREFLDGDAFKHTIGVLNELAQSMASGGQAADGQLPHHIAICITKFDEARVLETASELDLVSTRRDDEFGFPRVSEDRAEELLRYLCRLSGSGNADLMLDTLRQHFAPERTRYFVTSAIGFHVDPFSHAYNPDDYQNLLPDSTGQGIMRIRGNVRPINVVEPIMWLASRLAANSWQ